MVAAGAGAGAEPVTYCTFGASDGGFTPGRCVPIGIRRDGCSPSDASAGEESGVSFIVERRSERAVELQMRETGLEPARYYYH